MLNEKQLIVVNNVLNGLNIFLTGPPGTGKSYVLKEIIYKYKLLKKKNIFITATTGCAAVNINGITLHSLFGIKPNININNYVNKLLKLKFDNSIYKQIFFIDFLIIDEISMLDDKLCDNIDFILKKIKNNNKPFGGIQILFVGDFFQLAPVENTYCFNSKSWKELNPLLIELTEPIRHNNDMAFNIILSKLRYGIINEKIYNILKLLENNVFDNDIIKPTILYPNNIDVDKINNDNLNLLINNNNKFKTYYAEFKNVNKNNNYNVLLSENAQIMVTRNISINDKLINGTRGIIISLKEKSVIINTQNGIYEINYYIDYIDNNKTKFIKFLPLKLAYAISIHKSQGSTIDKLKIDIGNNIFANGQAYTALSRAKSLKDIQIININYNSFKTDINVIKWYNLQKNNN
jgi:ATP-dependent exoDNAse (exonuclease V) alpha subunit